MATPPLIARLIPTLFEDQQILAVSKPAGVDVGALSGPRADPRPGLVELLDRVVPSEEGLHPVNRLSRFESGVLVLARSAALAAKLRAEWKNEGAQQEYLAVVHGRASRRTNVGRESGDSGRKPPASGRNKPPVSRGGDARSGSETSIALVEHGQKRSLVRCRTTAPTTHALRAQLRAVRLRVVGDRVHQDDRRPAPIEQTFLHLARVQMKLPGSAKPLSLRSEPPPDPRPYLDRTTDPGRFLTAALVRRLGLLLERNTNGFRLITGPVEGLRGIVAERFGEVVVLQVHEERAGDPKLLREISRWYREVLGIQTVYTKSFIKSRREDPSNSGVPADDRPLLGRPAPDEIVVAENGLRFSIQVHAGQSVGLFLDQRDNRKRIREMSAGKDVLNLFAYTCGFSVAAGAGGARHTASVDVSPKHLDWGRRNFELNGLDLAATVADRSSGGTARDKGTLSATHAEKGDGPDRGDAASDEAAPGRSADGGDMPAHQFFKSDAADFLDRARRQGRTYDIVILDAPSFAHGRGRRAKPFSVATDLPVLIRQATAVLRRGGSLLVSTNFRKLTVAAIQGMVRKNTGDRRCRITPLPLPDDFAVDADHAKSVLATLD